MARLGSRQGRLSLSLMIAILATYISLWLTLDRKEILFSDFTPTYVGATLWLQNHFPYSLTRQATLHAHLILPFHEGNLPFAAAPLAAVLAAPLAHLSLVPAFWVASALSGAMLLGGTVFCKAL